MSSAKWQSFCLCFWWSSSIAGMLSHQLKQHVIDGEKAIIQNPTEAQRWVTPQEPKDGTAW